MLSRFSRRENSVRYAALADAGLLEQLPNETFDCLARSAVRMLQVPIAVLAVVDQDRELILGSVGLPEPWASQREVPLSSSLGKDVVDSGNVRLIRDLREEEHLRNRAVIEELDVVAYAAVPVGACDYVLGELCVLDREPREWRSDEIGVLRDLAGLAGREIEHRVELQRAQARARQDRAKLEELLSTKSRFRDLVERSLAGVYLIQEGRLLYANPRMGEIFGYPPGEIRGEPVEMLVAEEDRPRVRENLRRRLAGEVQGIRYGFRGLRKDRQIIDVEVYGSRTEVDGKPAVIGTLLDVTERKRAEQTLRRREEHMRALLENSWDVIHVVDAKGVIRYISPSVERLLGYTPDEMLGRDAAAFVHPDDAHRARATLEVALAHPGHRDRLELRLRAKDGSDRVVEVAGVSVLTDAGRPMGIVNTHDVTEQRRIEAALRGSEERYRLVVHATESAVWDWDVRTGKVFWNGESARMLRYAPGQMEGSIDWWYGRLHPEDRERVVASLDAALEHCGDLWSEEYRFRRGDGTYATVLDCCAVLRDEAGTAVRVVGSMRDVTERRRSEDLQRFLARASAVLDESLDQEVSLTRLASLIVPTLADGCAIDVIGDDRIPDRVAVMYADPAKQRLRADEERPLSKIETATHPIARAIRSGKPVLLPVCTDAALEQIGYGPRERAQLSALGLRSIMVVPLVAHHRTLGAITFSAAESGRRFGPTDLHVAEDLARRTATVIEHCQLYDAAQEAILARDEIAAMVSHDLRNPINTIQISASLVLDQAEDRRSTNVQPLQIIQRAAGQMTRLVEDLLDVSSIEAGRFAVEQVEHDVTLLFSEASAGLQPLAAQQSIALEWEAEEDLPQLRVDPHQILRVLSNLVGNSIKFTPEGGSIRVRAERKEDEIWFSVTDSGPGIPPEQLPHVFDRYWKARKGDRRGAGLGLAISKGIVEAHRGRIWAERPPEGGARFVFTVPIGIPLQPRPETRRKDTEPNHGT